MKTPYKVKVVRTFCKGCELCLGVCPGQVLELSESVNGHGVHFAQPNRNACIGCRKCAIICPEAAIEIRKLGRKK